jgi:hypothetical protein
MRKTASLVALFPTLRGEVLAATLTQPDKWWYLSELTGAYRQPEYFTANSFSRRRWPGTAVAGSADASYSRPM